jgi:hypothetical protein
VPFNYVIFDDNFEFQAIETDLGSKVKLSVYTAGEAPYEVDLMENVEQLLLGEYLWQSKDVGNFMTLALSKRARFEEESTFSVDLWRLTKTDDNISLIYDASDFLVGLDKAKLESMSF